MKIKGYKPNDTPKPTSKSGGKKSGITIIDGSAAPSPRFVFTPHPEEKEFKRAVEYQKYWETEKMRWIEGHQGLCGAHYQYLSQWKIKIGAQQMVGVPLWREDDEPVFQEIELCEQTKKELLWFSRREFGKTSIFAFTAYRQGRLYPSSSQVLTSSDKNKIFSIFGEKIIDILGTKDRKGYLHPAIAPKIININNTKQEMMAALSYPSKDGHEHIGRMWGIETTDTPKSPQNVSSKRAMFIGIDEVGLHNRRQALIGSARPALVTNGIRDGLLMMCGTIEAGIPSDSLMELQEMVRIAEETGDGRVLFTSYHNGMFMTNGYSDKKKAKEWWEKECEKLEKAGDRVGLMNFMKNYPPDLETALGIGGAGALPPDVMAKVVDQSKIIIKEKPPIQPHTLYLSQDTRNGVEAKLDRKGGKVLILEHPQEGVKYLSGIDPITGTSADMSEARSEHAHVIYKPTAQTIVAVYVERHLDMEHLYRNSLMLQKYYNECSAMVETNAGALLIDNYKKEGNLSFLSNTPKKLTVKMPKQMHGKGYRKLENIDVFLHNMLVNHLRQFTQNIWFQKLIAELPLYLKGNTDILDAFLAVLLEEEEEVRKFKNVTKEVRKREKRVPYYDSQGRLNFRWVEEEY